MRVSTSKLPSAALAWLSTLFAFATFGAGAAIAADPAPAPAPASATPAVKRNAPLPPAPAAAATPRPVVAAASPVAAAGSAAPAGGSPPARAPQATPPGAVAPRTSTVAPRTSTVAPRTIAAAPPTGALREPAPRPVTDVRVQSRFATKAKQGQLFGGPAYLSRGDYYNSPGARVGGTYYPLESIGVELQISHYWSSLNAAAERVKRDAGYIPDSHAPAWMFLAGARYSLGYGKLMVGGMGSAIHFEPQAFIHAGLHAYDGDVGPSSDLGLGLLVFLMPKMFIRIDAAIVYEREDRSGTAVGVWGTLPSFAFGGTL
jgi:hypothetical protein